MPWWGWVLVGVGLTLVIETLIFGALFVIGKGVASLSNIID